LPKTLDRAILAPDQPRIRQCRLCWRSHEIATRHSVRSRRHDPRRVWAGRSQWQRTIAAFADRLGPIEATIIAAAIEAATTELWADPARHKYWRHRTGAARRRIVATAFAALAATGHPVPPRRSVTHWPTP